MCLGQDPSHESRKAQGNKTEEKEKKKRYAPYSMVRYSITDAFYDEAGPRNQHDHLYNPEVQTHGLMAVPVRSPSPPVVTTSISGECSMSRQGSSAIGVNDTNNSKVYLKDFTF